jgi:hypothetical protein
LRPQSEIVEFTLGRAIDEMATLLLARAPRVIGLGVYIWNVEPLTRLVERIRSIAPGVTIVVGGPEVSHEAEQQRICALADFVITGWGDVTFAEIARQVLDGPRPLMKRHVGVQPSLATLALPYAEYSDTDVRERFVYVEASRGCPFKCAFCLSALDRTAWAFPLDPLLAALDDLIRRGARRFKFVDRTFNLKAESGARILQFFLEHVDQRPQDPPFVHFEMIPDRLPESLRAPIARFPAGTLHFEIGIQTFDASVQHHIDRRQDNAAAEANLAWLREHTHAQLHVDLIAGLPGEDLVSFAAGFDRLVALRPHEIQVGILKRLRGAPIVRQSDRFGLRFATDPPYALLENDCIDAATMRRIDRFARYWERIGNAGRFARTLPLLLAERPFDRFMACADWLYGQFGATTGIANEALYEALLRWLTAHAGVALSEATAALAADYIASGARGKVSFVPSNLLAPARPRERVQRGTPARQARRLQA